MLGGLMRGTTGAFLRGALGTATQAIQQVNLDDQEEIKTGVEKFGSKYETYQEGLKEYQTERKKINTVASALAAQDPEFVKDLDADQLEGVAQALMIRSGKDSVGDVLEYFMNNRHELKPVAAPTVPTVTPADEQTAAVMAPQPEERGFFEKLFKGKTQNEIADSVAKEAGVSREQYDAIMAGKLPTVGDPSMMLQVRQDDKFQEIIDKRMDSVVTAISNQDFLKGNYTLPSGVSVTGKEFAGMLMQEHQNYSINGGDGAKLARMQQFALTQVMPEKAKDLFEFHSKSIDKISGGMANPKISQQNRDAIEAISSQIYDMSVSAAKNPGFFDQPQNVTKMNGLVTSGLKLLATEEQSGGKITEGPQYKLLNASINGIMKRIDTTSNTARRPVDAETEARMRQLRDKLAIAVTAEDPVQAMADLSVEVQDLSINGFGAAPLSDSQGDAVTMMQTLRGINSRFRNMSDAELEPIAKQVLLLNPKGITKGTDDINYLTIPDANGMPRSVPIGVQVDGAIVTDISAEQVSENRAALKENANNLTRFAKLTTGLEASPAVFTALGAFNVTFGNYASALGTITNTDLGRLYDQTFGSSQDSETRREAIALIGKAKDELFDDPRLSDQDLRLVLKFVSILDTELNGIGTGKENAMAALQGLQVALMKDSAMRLYENSAGKGQIAPLTSINKPAGWDGLHWYDDKGNYKIDNSIAGNLMKGLHAAYNFTPLSKQQVFDLANTDANASVLYAAKEDMFNKIVENAIHDLAVYEALNVPVEERQSSLLDMGATETIDAGDGTSYLQMTVNGTQYRVQSLEEAKRQASLRRS